MKQLMKRIFQIWTDPKDVAVFGPVCKMKGTGNIVSIYFHKY